MDEINILYTTDHNYIKYMLVSLYSLLENNSHMKVIIHIICDRFESEDYKLIESIISEFGNANIYFYDFKGISKIIDEYSIPRWRDTTISNARLFFTDCIKNVDKLLYLDSDTVIVNSLSGLVNYNGTIHMVKDSMATDYWQNLGTSLEMYCNSGVLWIDVNKWKEENCDSKIINVLDGDISYTYPDQDLLNIALKDDIKLLPPEYNLFPIDVYYNPTFLSRYYEHSGIERYKLDDILNARNNPIILHSTPFYYWRSLEENKVHPYNKIYDEYLYKIFGYIEKEHCNKSPNPLLYKLYLYSKLACPLTIKNKVKSLIKN